jgi:hypothetical protein
MEDRNHVSKVILENAKRRKREGKTLSQVEAVILREWVVYLCAELHKLELEAQHKMLSDEKYERMKSLKERINRYGGGEC